MANTRFHDGRSGATHAVEPVVFGRDLLIEGAADQMRAVWPLDQVRAAPEIDPDGMTVLTARDRLGVLSTGDAVLLESLRRAGVRLPRQRTWTRRHWVGVGAGFGASLAVLALGLNALPGWIAAAIPVSWERKLGDPMAAAMTAASPRCEGMEGQAALNRLVERLRAAGKIAIPVDLSVLNDGMVNAFTLPGGRVLVMRGLIDEAADGAVLAGVIAHELGHVSHRDSATMLVREMGFQLLLASLGLGDMGGAAIGGASQLTARAYGRAAEAAADDTAIELLTAAGLRADGLSRFFARLDQAHGQRDGTEDASPNRPAGLVPSWLSTHPPDRDRRARTARPESGEMPFTAAEWAAIRGMCRRKDLDNRK